jgi:hypothetical protein
VRMAGNFGSIRRRWLPFLDVFHSCSHSLRICFRILTLSWETRRGKGCILFRPTAILASLSAASFPVLSQCPGIHWRRRGMPRAFNSAAACKLAWMIRCPDLLPGFLMACSADMLSQRIVAGSCCGVVEVLGLELTTFKTRLMA